MKVRSAWALVVVMVGCGGSGSGDPNPTNPSFVTDTGDMFGGDVAMSDAACASASVRAGRPPVDLILSIDQSGSMSSTIASVKANINKLAGLLDSNGLDAHVVIIAAHGAPKPGCFVTNLGPDKCPTAETHPACWQNFEVCVPPPLGAAPCGAENLPRFFQSNYHIESTDMLQIALNTYSSPLADVGWKKMMRKEALKVFIPITDDNAAVSTTTLVTCTAASYDLSADWWSKSCTDRYAAASKPPYEGKCMPDYKSFDDALVTRDPAQFGTKSHRNYVVYPVVGAKPYPDETQCGCFEKSSVGGPGPCTGPYTTNNGQQYLELAKLTGGKWHSLCDVDFAPIFSKLAADTVERVACELAIPAPPAGESLDYARVNVTWTSAKGAASTVPQDASAPCASANGWQYDEAKTRILLCGDACTRARGDAASRFDVAFGCRTIVR